MHEDIGKCTRRLRFCGHVAAHQKLLHVFTPESHVLNCAFEVKLLPLPASFMSHGQRDGCLRDGHEDDDDNKNGAKLAQHSHSGSWRHQTCTITST